jgi:hypothetical protein
VSAALKHGVSSHTFDQLRTHPEEFANTTIEFLQTKVNVIGVRLISITINEVAYAAGMQNSMLRKQEAQQIANARAVTVQGVVGMIKDCIKEFDSVLSVDDKSKLASNMLLFLTSNQNMNSVKLF